MSLGLRASELWAGCSGLSGVSLDGEFDAAVRT